MASLAEAVGVPATVLWVVAGVFAGLAVGTGARLIAVSGAPADKRRARLGSLVAWWVIAATIAVVVLLGRGATMVLFCAASLRGLYEFLRLVGPRRGGRSVQALAFAAVPLHYLWIYLGWTDLVRAFLPAFVFLLLPARVILTDRPQGFIRTVAGLTWGLGLVVFCFSHVALFFTLPDALNPVGGAAGWIVYLVLLTEAHDIFQALWGRPFGKHKLTPGVSPGKSWEGFVLGALTTLALSALVAPLLTPFPLGRAILAGLLIAVGGLFGDLTMSAVKRDIGVKDTGTLIPGQGGLLDRIDSLTFTAPLFFYFVVLL